MFIVLTWVYHIDFQLIIKMDFEGTNAYSKSPFVSLFSNVHGP